MSIRDSLFITPEDAVRQISEYVNNDEVKGDATLEPIALILERVAIVNSITERGLKAGIIEALQRNPNGITSASLWAWLKRGGDTIPMSSVEAALSELELEKKAHIFRGGVLSIWLLGAVPSPEEDKK